jgi:hypothetical protein
LNEPATTLKGVQEQLEELMEKKRQKKQQEE